MSSVGGELVLEFNELNRIIDNEEITTMYQAIISLKTGKILGYEALSRGGHSSSILHSPEKLFSVADKFNKLGELDYLCRKRAIENACNMDESKLLFINVEPLIFNDKMHEEKISKEFSSKYNISNKRIVYEITERKYIENPEEFRKILDFYSSEGYKIAIDDMGAGFSGLNRLVQIRPQYIKIDMNLIRDIDSDHFKQAIIKAFVELSNNTNINLIAEGIETEEELKTLILLGVYAGQGYFLQSPCSQIEDINRDIRNIIYKYNKLLTFYG